MASPEPVSHASWDPPGHPGELAPAAAPSDAELPRTVLQRWQSRNIWRHLRQDAVRVGALVGSDAILYVMIRGLIRGVREGWLGSQLATVAGDVFPYGFLGGGRFAVALFLCLALAGTYGSGDARRNGSLLLGASAMASLLTLYGAFWHEGQFLLTLARCLAVTAVFSAALMISRTVLDSLVWRVRPRVTVSRALVVAHTDADWRDLALLLTRVRDFVVVGNVTLHSDSSVGIHPRLRGLGQAIEECRAETVLLWGHLTKEEFGFAVDVALASGCRLLAGARTSVGDVEPRGVWMGGRQLVELTPPALRGWQVALKRAMDLAGAAIGLTLAAPLFLAIAVAILIEDGFPVFFRQRRIGRAGRPFMILKFRSMVTGAEQGLEQLRAQSIYDDGRLFKVVGDPRVTRVGRILRKTSLDELPQLINVLLGHMSLVGPRPPIPAEVEAYAAHHFSRFDVKPGITGPWQAGGRNSITDFEKVVRMESEYVRKWSVVEDLRILLRTIPAVLRGSGAH